MHDFITLPGLGRSHYLAARTACFTGLVDIRWNRGFVLAWESLRGVRGQGISQHSLTWVPNETRNSSSEFAGSLLDWSRDTGDTVAYTLMANPGLLGEEKGSEGGISLYDQPLPSLLSSTSFWPSQPLSASGLLYHHSRAHTMDRECGPPGLIGLIGTWKDPGSLCVWQGHEDGSVRQRTFSWGTAVPEDVDPEVDEEMDGPIHAWTELDKEEMEMLHREVDFQDLFRGKVMRDGTPSLRRRLYGESTHTKPTPVSLLVGIGIIT